MEQINEIGKIAGSISAIIALLLMVFIKPIKKVYGKHKQDKTRKQKEQDAFRAELKASLNRINETLHALSDDIGDLQYERLSQAQDFYISRGWCPGSKKEMLCKMHSSYRAKGRNHLSEHYEEEILQLPDHPNEDS